MMPERELLSSNTAYTYWSYSSLGRVNGLEAAFSFCNFQVFLSEEVYQKYFSFAPLPFMVSAVMTALTPRSTVSVVELKANPVPSI